MRAHALHKVAPPPVQRTDDGIADVVRRNGGTLARGDLQASCSSSSSCTPSRRPQRVPLPCQSPRHRAPTALPQARTTCARRTGCGRCWRGWPSWRTRTRTCPRVGAAGWRGGCQGAPGLRTGRRGTLAVFQALPRRCAGLPPCSAVRRAGPSAACLACPSCRALIFLSCWLLQAASW